MDHLVHVEEKEITINFELSRKCKTELRLRSLMHTMPVAFKLQTTSPYKFSVRPSNGYIQPLADFTLEVTLRPQQELPPTFPFSDEKLVLKTALAPFSSDDDSLLPGKVCKEWFESPTTHIYVDAKLKVVYIGAHLLRKCVKNGDVFAVEQILLRQTAVSAASEDGRTALHVAASIGSSNMVDMLLQYGADIDATDAVGRTPLWEAITGGHADLVQELLAHRAHTDISEPFRNPSTAAIHVAAKLASPKVLKMLLESGAALETKDQEGRTALHYAVEEEKTESLKVLLRAGADVNAKGTDGRTPLLIAADNGSFKMVHLLLEAGANTNIKAENQHATSEVVIVEDLKAGEELLRATRRGDVKAVTTLLQHSSGGKKTWAQDTAGWTALHVAAFKGHVQIVRRLLLAEGGAQALQEPDAEGHTPLHCAAEGGSREVVELLLAMGANPLAASSRGATPAELASALGFTPIARLLQQQAYHPAIYCLSQGQLHAKSSESMGSSITKSGTLRRQSVSPDPDLSSLHVRSMTPSLHHKKATTASSIRFSTPDKLPQNASQQQLQNKRSSGPSSLRTHADGILEYSKSTSLTKKNSSASSQPHTASETDRFKSSDVKSTQHPEAQKVMRHAGQSKHPFLQPMSLSTLLKPPAVLELLKATEEQETAPASHVQHTSTGQIFDHRKDAATSKPQDIGSSHGSNLQNSHQHKPKQTLAVLLNKVHGSKMKVDSSSSGKSIENKKPLDCTDNASNQRDKSARRKVAIPASDMLLQDRTILQHQYQNSHNLVGGTKHQVQRNKSAIKEIGVPALHMPAQDRAFIQNQIKDSNNCTDGNQQCPRTGAAPLFQRHKNPAKQVAAILTSDALVQERTLAFIKNKVRDGNNQHHPRQDAATLYQRNKSATIEATTPTSSQQRAVVQSQVKDDRNLHNGNHNSAKQNAACLIQRNKGTTKEVTVPPTNKDRAPIHKKTHARVSLGYHHPVAASSPSKKTQPPCDEAQTRLHKYDTQQHHTNGAEIKECSDDHSKLDASLSIDEDQALHNSRITMATQLPLLAVERPTSLECKELKQPLFKMHQTGNAIEDPSFHNSVSMAQPQFSHALNEQNNLSSASLYCNVDDNTTAEDTKFITSSRSLISHSYFVNMPTAPIPADFELQRRPHMEQACPSLSTPSSAPTPPDKLLQSEHNHVQDRFASPDPSHQKPTPPQEEMMRDIDIHIMPSHRNMTPPCKTDQIPSLEETRSLKPTCKASWNDQNGPIYTPPLRIRQMRRAMSTPILRNSNSPRRMRTEEVPAKATGTSEEKPAKGRSVTIRELFSQGTF